MVGLSNTVSPMNYSRTLNPSLPGALATPAEITAQQTVSIILGLYQLERCTAQPIFDPADLPTEAREVLERFDWLVEEGAQYLRDELHSMTHAMLAKGYEDLRRGFGEDPEVIQTVHVFQDGSQLEITPDDLVRVRFPGGMLQLHSDEREALTWYARHVAD